MCGAEEHWRRAKTGARIPLTKENIHSLVVLIKQLNTTHFPPPQSILRHLM